MSGLTGSVRAPSGYAAAPPRRVTNSRRFIALTPDPRIMRSSRSGPCIAAKAAHSCPLWVKSGKAQNEQMLSALPPKAGLPTGPI